MKVGILGAGQLASLLAHSAYQLNLETLCLTHTQAVPAKRNSALFIGHLEQPADLRAFAQQVDVITLENENVDLAVLATLAALKPVYPDANIVQVAQDRFLEKSAFLGLGIPTPAFEKIDSVDDLAQACQKIGLPAMLKTRRLGYDGKGQALIRSRADINLSWQKLNAPCILEAFVPFDHEVSLLGARDQAGNIVFYPLIHNVHEGGILRTSTAPFLNATLQRQAERYLGAIFKQFHYVGVMALEFFVEKGQLIANEMAPRVHNSGHLTMEGCNVSQFENHLRAVTALPLVTPKVLGKATMTNVIGTWPRDLVCDINTHIYHYGKTLRAGRKLGHMTRVDI